MAETLALKVKEEDFLGLFIHRYLEINYRLFRGGYDYNRSQRENYALQQNSTKLLEKTFLPPMPLGATAGFERADEIITVVGNQQKVLRKRCE